MNKTLFRTEDIQARQAAWLGGIRFGHIPTLSVVTERESIGNGLAINSPKL